MGSPIGWRWHGGLVRSQFGRSPPRVKTAHGEKRCTTIGRNPFCSEMMSPWQNLPGQAIRANRISLDQSVKI
jgi:hypothetical protein